MSLSIKHSDTLADSESLNSLMDRYFMLEFQVIIQSDTAPFSGDVCTLAIIQIYTASQGAWNSPDKEIERHVINHYTKWRPILSSFSVAPHHTNLVNPRGECLSPTYLVEHPHPFISLTRNLKQQYYKHTQLRTVKWVGRI